METSGAYTRVHPHHPDPHHGIPAAAHHRHVSGGNEHCRFADEHCEVDISPSHPRHPGAK